MKLVIANLFNKITEQLWYDAKSDSTLHRYDWRFHHNGISLKIMLITSLFAPRVYAFAGIMLSFFIYKFFFQGKLKDKKLKDFQDAVADGVDYMDSWLLVVYPDVTNTLLSVLLLMILYILTINWSRP